MTSEIVGIYGLLLTSIDILSVFRDKIIKGLSEALPNYFHNKELSEITKESIELLYNNQYADFDFDTITGILEDTFDELDLDYKILDDSVIIGITIRQMNIWDVLPSKQILDYLKEGSKKSMDKAEKILKNEGLLSTTLVQLATLESQKKYKKNIPSLNIPIEIKERLTKKIFSKNDLDFYII